MPDSLALPSATARRGADPERRSACTGLPLVQTVQMTVAERDALRELQRALALVQDRIEEALVVNRAAFGLQACALAGDLGVAAARCAATLGTRR